MIRRIIICVLVVLLTSMGIACVRTTHPGPDSTSSPEHMMIPYSSANVYHVDIDLVPSQRIYMSGEEVAIEVKLTNESPGPGCVVLTQAIPIDVNKTTNTQIIILRIIL